MITAAEEFRHRKGGNYINVNIFNKEKPRKTGAFLSLTLAAGYFSPTLVSKVNCSPAAA